MHYWLTVRHLAQRTEIDTHQQVHPLDRLRHLSGSIKGLDLIATAAKETVTSRTNRLALDLLLTMGHSDSAPTRQDAEWIGDLGAYRA